MSAPYDLKDEKQAKEYLENLGIEYKFQCLHEKSPDGCHRLADFEESIRKDFDKAARIYKSNCLESNYGHSCYKFANYSLLGRGTPKDEREAYNFHGRGCEAGYMPACHNQALLAGSGKVRHKRDYPKAVQLFTKACEAGNANSCYQLSSIFIQGKEGVEPSMQKASEYSEKACDFGIMYACANLSRMYTRGDGVAQDMDKARVFRKKAKEIENSVRKNQDTLTFTG